MTHDTLTRPALITTRRQPAADIADDDWESLVPPGGFYTGPAWTRSLHAAYSPSPVITATGPRARLVGVLPTWANTTPTGMFSAAELADGLPGPWDKRLLWVGTHRGTSNALTCTRDHHLRDSTMRALLEEARRLAAARGLAGVIWPYLPGHAALEAAAAHDHAHAILHGADATIEIPRTGMAGLEAATTSHARAEMRREQRQFGETAAVAWVPLSSSVANLIAPLLARTRSKYGAGDVDSGTALMRRILSAQMSSAVAGSAVVALATTGTGRTVAAAVFYRRGTYLHGRYWGADADAPPYAYFQLTIYAPVDWAARHRIQHLHLSVPASPAKISRGARISPLAMVFVPAGPTPLDQAALDRHNQQVATQWMQRCASRPAALDPGWSRWSSAGTSARPAAGRN